MSDNHLRHFAHVTLFTSHSNTGIRFDEHHFPDKNIEPQKVEQSQGPRVNQGKSQHWTLDFLFPRTLTFPRSCPWFSGLLVSSVLEELGS